MTVDQLLADPTFKTYAMARNLAQIQAAVFIVRGASPQGLEEAYWAWHEETFSETPERPRLRLVASEGEVA